MKSARRLVVSPPVRTVPIVAAGASHGRLKAGAALVSVLACMLLGGCVLSLSGTRVSEERSLIATWVEGETYDIVTRNGDVTVIYNPDREDVLIDAVVQAGGSSEEEARTRLSAMQIIANHDSTSRTLQIYLEYPDDKPVVNDGADFRIETPGARGISIKTSNGQVAVQGLTGEATLTSSNGTITVIDHDGPVVARSSNGAIDIRNARDKVDAATSNGRIALTTVPSFRTPFTLDTSNGRINIALPSTWVGVIDADTSNGGINVGPLVSTTGGSIGITGDHRKRTIRVNESLAEGNIVTSVADTSNGTITIDFVDASQPGASGG